MHWDLIVEFTYYDTTEVAGTVGNAKAAKKVETKKGRTSTIENKGNTNDTE